MENVLKAGFKVGSMVRLRRFGQYSRNVCCLWSTPFSIEKNDNRNPSIFRDCDTGVVVESFIVDDDTAVLKVALPGGKSGWAASKKLEVVA